MKYKVTKKDAIFIVVFGVLVALSTKGYIQSYGLENIGSILERILLIMLSFVTVVDIASHTNWSILVPDFFELAREKKHKKEVKEYIEAYLKNEVNFWKDYSQEKINFLLSQLGINMDQLDEIRLELVRMRCIPLKDLDDAKEKIKRLVTNDYPIVINQEKIDSAKVCYNKVTYYINITDIMFLPEYARELSAILSFLISEVLNLSTIDKLVVPYDSNFLLAVEVGKKLGKPVVKMRYQKGKIETEKCWDGNLEPKDRVIIIHDVLVTGDQIIETKNKLPRTCTIMGLFCLIVRKEWHGKNKLEKNGITCHQIIELDDNDICRLQEGN